MYMCVYAFWAACTTEQEIKPNTITSRPNNGRKNALLLIPLQCSFLFFPLADDHTWRVWGCTEGAARRKRHCCNGQKYHPNMLKGIQRHAIVPSKIIWNSLGTYALRTFNIMYHYYNCWFTASVKDSVRRKITARMQFACCEKRPFCE